jgi:hypothetical protein
MIEIWGYLSMCVVLISTMMKNVKTLRITNIIGCIMFIIYGSILGAYPIVVMNTLVILIHVWRLVKD